MGIFQQTFMVKGQIRNILAFVEPYSLCHNTQPCHCNVKAAIDDRNEWAWLCSIKTSFRKTSRSA